MQKLKEKHTYIRYQFVFIDCTVIMFYLIFVFSHTLPQLLLLSSWDHGCFSILSIRKGSLDFPLQNFDIIIIMLVLFVN